MSDEVVNEPESLAEAVLAAGLELDAKTLQQVDAYRALLWEWNEKMNLTRHTTMEKFASRDLVDTMRLAELLDRGERVLDVGSGGGVPGILLAIVRPDLKVSLCESVAKKARVLEAMTEQLGLEVRVYGVHVQQVLEVATFDTLVARAVAPLKKNLVWVQPHWEAVDRLLLIKGRSWVDERGEARHHGLLAELDLRKAAEYVTPLSDAVSVIVMVSPKGAAGE